jgi:hypothetical protein
VSHLNQEVFDPREAFRDGLDDGGHDGCHDGGNSSTSRSGRFRHAANSTRGQGVSVEIRPSQRLNVNARFGLPNVLASIH